MMSSSSWRDNFIRAIRDPRFKAILKAENLILETLLKQRALSGLSRNAFNQLIVDSWNDFNYRIPQIDEADELYFIIPQSTVEYWKSLPFDLFKKIIFDQNIKGRDLISLCVSHPSIGRLCDHHNREIFRTLLNRDYSVIDSENPRIDYLEYSQGTVWTFGSGFGGKLGHSNDDDLLVPTRIPFLRGIVDISAKTNLIAALDRLGRVFVWGTGLLDDDRSIFYPIQVLGLPPIKKISCGSRHLVMLDESGQIWTYGSPRNQNLLGEGVSDALEFPVDRDRFLPLRIPEFRNVKDIAAGDALTLLIDQAGRVWKFGENIRFGGRIVNYPIPVSNHRDVISVACGIAHYALLDGVGQVWTWGTNIYGNLGIGPTAASAGNPIKIPDVTEIRQISCGVAHTGYIDSFGQIWTFGRGSTYETGHGIRENILTPRMLPDITGALQISCGDHHTAFIDFEGRVHTFGSGLHGALGHGNQRRRRRPKVIEGFENVKKVVCAQDFTAFIL